jgi:hypothetical protein
MSGGGGGDHFCGARSLCLLFVKSWLMWGCVAPRMLSAESSPEKCDREDRSLSDSWLNVEAGLGWGGFGCS